MIIVKWCWVFDFIIIFVKTVEEEMYDLPVVHELRSTYTVASAYSLSVIFKVVSLCCFALLLC